MHELVIIETINCVSPSVRETKLHTHKQNTQTLISRSCCMIKEAENFSREKMEDFTVFNFLFLREFILCVLFSLLICGPFFTKTLARFNTRFLQNADCLSAYLLNTLRTGDADLCFYITTVQDGWPKSAFLTRACFPCTIHFIMQYIEPVSEWSCWRMFIETWPHSELTFRHRASSIEEQAFRYSPENAFYVFNLQIYFIIWYLLDGASLI